MPTQLHPAPVIVTGGAAGIGYAIAHTFAAKGHKVGLVDLSADECNAAVIQLIKDTGATVCSATADVSDPESSKVAYDNIVSAIGPAGVLINNAGFMPPRKGRIEEIPLDDFQQMMNVHVGGAVHWCRLAIPSMRERKFGRIINMSSVNAVQPVPHRYTYVTAKKALRGLTEALALDCARDGITVNAIAPGYILTDTLKERAEQGLLNQSAIAERTPAGRWGQPHEIAHIAQFLADPASAYITGTTMTVDGGLSIRGDANEDLDNSPFSL